jgi:hypothetical protein
MAAQHYLAELDRQSLTAQIDEALAVVSTGDESRAATRAGPVGLVMIDSTTRPDAFSLEVTALPTDPARVLQLPLPTEPAGSVAGRLRNASTMLSARRR